MNPFTYEDQVVVSKAIRSAFRIVIRRYGEEQRNSVILDIAGLAKIHQISLITTSKGLGSFSDQVFSAKVFRDFVFALSSTFYTHWGEAESKYDGLVESLTRANGIANKTRNFMDKKIMEEFDSLDETRVLLKSNEWLIPLLLVAAYYEDDWIKNG